VLGLSELINRAVGTYSGGQRRRLELARALVSQPEVLFLDEPTVGLDPRIRHELLDVISGLRERDQMTILLTTHYLEEAQRLCDRVAIMHLGRIVALDSPAGLLAGLGSEILELRVASDPVAALALLRTNGIAEKNAFAVGSTLTLPLHERPASEVVVAIHETGLATSGITTRPTTLDDVYLHFTGAPIADAA
jgi:ABC-2 type transport system ATP-binding protein